MSLRDLHNRIRKRTGGWSKNVGPTDAKVRVTVGVLLVALAPLQALGHVPIPLFSSIGAAFAGIVLVVEGVLSRCVLYSILGIDRCPVD